MKLYGYAANEDLADKLLELDEITIQAKSEFLRRIADFITKSADLIDKHGANFGHEHLKDFLKDVEWDGPDIIISKYLHRY